jgi:Lytic transglycolase
MDLTNGSTSRNGSAALDAVPPEGHAPISEDEREDVIVSAGSDVLAPREHDIVFPRFLVREIIVAVGTSSISPSFNADGLSGFQMSRLAMAVAGVILGAMLPSQAEAQTATSDFSGLCTYYPARGNGLTAAHRTLPFGTRVRITDPKTGRSVVVVINDRGPFGRHRVIDISVKAARALGMMDRGVILVRADIL